jgi:dTMP kinase
VINPGLAKGAWVLSDRYLFSTVSFQGYGRGINRNWIDQANSLAIQERLPSLVILLDLPVAEACKRIQNRKDGGRDSFEDEAIEFQQRIRDGFLECADTSPVPFLVLDATKKPEELAAESLAALLE